MRNLMNLREAIEKISRKQSPGSAVELCPVKYLPRREAREGMEIRIMSI